MKDSWLIQVSRFFRSCSARFLVRFVAFVVVMQFAIQSPGWARSSVWLLVLLAGIWAFFALIRESGQAMDFLIPRLEQGYRKMAALRQKHENVWRTITLFCAVGIFAAATYRAWSAWEFMATSSLRTDEIVNISRYTSRGLVPSIGDYKRARNHVFFNILTTLLPGADSTLPVRARLISFLSVGGAVAVLVVYAGVRGWLLAGLACAGLLVVNLSTLKVVLEARGYGLIFLCAMVGCTVFAEWLRSRNQVWLKILGISCVLGTYTLPFYIVFGGSLLLLAFAYRPTRETLLMGILSLAAIGILYLPVVGGLYTVFAGYDERYSEETSNFNSFDGVLRTLQYFIPYDLLQPNAFLFVLISVLVLAYISFGRFAHRSDRVATTGIIAAAMTFLAFCLFFQAVPIRVSAYIAAPLAFVSTVVVGSALSARTLVPFRPLVQTAFTLLAIGALWRSEISEPLIPRQNWRDIAIFIERAFPAGTRVWMVANYGALLLRWNLASRNRPETGTVDQYALSTGRLVAVEGIFGYQHEGSRLRWEDLPEGVRFVTFPLLVNYQRVFFFPPASRGIASVSVSDHQIPFFVSGRQPFDPALLSRSAGNGDILRREDLRSGDGPDAQAEDIPIPSMMTLSLEPGAAAGTCNLLFSQGMEDKTIIAQVQDSRGIWRATSKVFMIGEFVSVALKEEGCLAVKIAFGKRPSVSNHFGEPANRGRPPFGLIDSWVSAGSTRNR
jgi:hypothetical protein